MKDTSVASEQAAAPQSNILIKIGFIIVLMLLLLIPLVWIQNLINERENLQEQVRNDITQSWGPVQTMTGPVLCIPYYTTEISGKSIEKTEHVLYCSPEQLNIHSDIRTEQRKKGIFSAVVYHTADTLKGTFNLTEIPLDPKVTYQWEKAILITGLTDPTCITQSVATLWNDAPVRANIGVKYEGFVSKGFYSPVNVRPDQKEYTFSITAPFRGSGTLQYLPVGKSSQLSVQSDWPSPSFSGKQLPVQKAINTSGFTAQWSSSEFNRPVPDYWSDTEVRAGDHSASMVIGLVQTASEYQQNMRSAKYGFLVISLSFMLFFFYEVMVKVRIHPVQYSMIGLSLVIFYALLLSFTEHFGFKTAYITAYIAVVSLLAMYVYAILGTMKATLSIVGLYTLLYAYIYVILQLEDFALLVGSLGVFFVLALVMFLSRKIDWYRLSSRQVVR